MESRRFEIRGISRPEDIRIDNGEFRAILNKAAFVALCTKKNVPEHRANDAWMGFEKFKVLTDEGKKEGIAHGSSDPIGAISNELFKWREAYPDFPEFTDDEVREFVKQTS